MVPSDVNGRMIPSELERLIIDRKTRGHIPFFVACTSGTTVLGAFDPINEIADICEKYGMWLHVDVRLCFSILLIKSKYIFSNLRRYNLTINKVGNWWGLTWTQIKLFAGGLGWRTFTFEKIPTSSTQWHRKVSKKNVDPLLIIKSKSLSRLNPRSSENCADVAPFYPWPTICVRLGIISHLFWRFKNHIEGSECF